MDPHDRFDFKLDLEGISQDAKVPGFEAHIVERDVSAMKYLLVLKALKDVFDERLDGQIGCLQEALEKTR